MLEDEGRRLALNGAVSNALLREGRTVSCLSGLLFLVRRVRAYLRVANNVEQGNNVGSASEVLQNLDLSLNLLLLNWLEHLDYAFLIVDNVDSFEDFRVLSATCENGKN